MLPPYSKPSDFLLLYFEENETLYNGPQSSAWSDFCLLLWLDSILLSWCYSGHYAVSFLFKTSFWTRQVLSCLSAFAPAMPSACDVPPSCGSALGYLLSYCSDIIYRGAFPYHSISGSLTFPFPVTAHDTTQPLLLSAGLLCSPLLGYKLLRSRTLLVSKA